jgi:1-acyl-sn-glycerol-3-phosphate acyltransferase
MKKETLRSIVHFLFRNLARLEYYNLEYIPTSGPVILATNHLSRLDIPLLFINPIRKDITALVTDKYLNYPVIRWFTTTGGGIWIDRDRADFNALSTAREVLNRGMMLGIAPEGTRSKTRQLLEGKPGTILIALRSGAPILPVGVTGTEESMGRILTLQRPRISVRVGKPFHIPPLDREKRSEQLKYWSDELMLRIAALLPDKYHGYYRNHPRLKELQAEHVDISGPVAV